MPVTVAVIECSWYDYIRMPFVSQDLGFVQVTLKYSATITDQLERKMHFFPLKKKYILS